MIIDQSIVCMPLTTWDSTFTNTVVKMMTLLSRQNRILFVDYQYTLKDILAGVTGKRNVPVKRIFGLENRLRKVKTVYGSEVYVLTVPPVFPINWIKDKSSYNFMLTVNASIVKNSIHKAIKDLSMRDIIMINGYNSFLGLPLAGEFNEILNIYYCYDEIKGDQWYSFHGPDVEREYMKKADIVITTSEALYDSKCFYTNNCCVVKNGVDFELFNQVANRTKEPSGPKVVGYTGSIDERFDYETMAFVIQSLPEVRFEFVGRVTNQRALREISQYPNVVLHGSKKPEAVPPYLVTMDVCIIPYLKNEVTKGVYPLKINEYLAAGKPVVMTDFAPLSEFEGMVGISKDKYDFLRLVKEAISSDSEERKKNRIEHARNNSWQHRVEEFSSYVSDYLIMKSAKVLAEIS